jgi:hypothetical protein
MFKVGSTAESTRVKQLARHLDLKRLLATFADLNVQQKR